MNQRYWNSGPKTVRRLHLARAMPPDLRPGEVVRAARPKGYERRSDEAAAALWMFGALAAMMALVAVVIAVF